jgi:hypothetical protein
MNGSPLLLIRILAQNGKIPPSRWPVMIFYMLRVSLMFPFSLYEYVFLSRKIKATQIKQTPIFVIGFYRSGTTMLHKYLITDKRWGYINTFQFIFPYATNFMESVFKPLLQSMINFLGIRNRHFNNYRIGLDDPLEEDMMTISAITPYSAFWAEVFPKNAADIYEKQIFFRNEQEKKNWQTEYLYYLKKLTRKTKGKRLLLKNPPNTGRIPALLELFPDAKFIFIYRNPYQVYYSTVNLWKNTLERLYALHKITDEERDKIIYGIYEKINRRYEKDKSLVSTGNLAEVRYEDLITDPCRELRKIYDELGLDGFESVENDLMKIVTKDKKYKPFSYQFDRGEQDAIYRNCGHFIDKWNYDRLPVGNDFKQNEKERGGL